MDRSTYDFILKQFDEQPIKLPSLLNVNELKAWLMGYEACLNRNKSIIIELRENACRK